MLAKAIESELHFLVGRMGIGGWIGHLLAIVFFGILVPYREGLDFLDVMILLAYAGLPCLFAAPMVAESVAGRRGLPPRESYLAQVFTPIIFSLFWNTLILATGFATVNLSSRFPRLFLPNSTIAIVLGILSFAAVFLAASTTGWLSLNVQTASAAKGHSRRLFLLLLLGVVMWTRMAPPAWRNAVESRLTPSGIPYLVLPVALTFILIGGLLLRAGVQRRLEEVEGPLFKL